MKVQTEEELIKMAQQDKKSFEKLYENYGSKIKSYILTKVNYDSFTAEDLSSATFEKAFLNIKNYKWQGISFSAWIYKIANNTLIDYYRSAKKFKGSENTDDVIVKDPGTNIEETATAFDSSSRIAALLNILNEREREIIILKFYEGYTNKEISEKIGISESNVSTILHRSMGKLRKMPSLEGYL